MATTEERVTTLEALNVTLGAVAVELAKKSDHHDAQISELRAMTAEIKRDADHTQRIWVWICRKYGLPGDKDLKGPWDEDGSYGHAYTIGSLRSSMGLVVMPVTQDKLDTRLHTTLSGLHPVEDNTGNGGFGKVASNTVSLTAVTYSPIPAPPPPASGSRCEAR